MKQIFTILLYPFSILYDLGTRFRNHQYNIDLKKSFQFDTNVISVGNLSVGGTGKTPVVEYLLRLLKDKKVATLSRGYGRKTKGFRIADDQDSAITLGDEPFQFYKKFDDVMVAVGEDRAMAIPQILYHREEIELIILDDAYQHRSVIPNLSILLTEYDRPFFGDYVLPAGRLREARNNANRSDVVIVTKCPDQVDDSVLSEYSQKISKYTKDATPIFFSKISYQSLQLIFGKAVEQPKSVYLLTGIAKKQPFVDYMSKQYNVVGERHFTDHYQYKEEDVAAIVEEFDKVNTGNTIIVTTEKDMVRLLRPSFDNIFGDRPMYYVPIEVRFLQNGALFDEMVLKSINSKTILE